MKLPVIDNRLAGYSIDNNPYDLIAGKLSDKFGSSRMIQVMIEPGNVRSGEILNSLSEIESELRRTFPAIRISSLHTARSLLRLYVDGNEPARTLLEKAIQLPVTNNLVSRDTSSFLLYAFADACENFDLVRFDSLIKNPVEGIISATPVSLDHIHAGTEEAIIRDYATILPLVLMIVFAGLYYSYRTFGAVLIGAVHMIISAVIVLFFYFALGVSINQITASAFTISVILSVSLTVHMLTGYRHAVVSGEKEPVFMLLKRYLLPSFLATLTTAVAFGSFLVSESNYMRQFGGVSAVSIMVSFLMIFFMAPVLLPALIKPSGLPKELPAIKLQRIIHTHRKLIGLVLCGILAISLVALPGLRFKINPETYIPRHSAVYDNYIKLRGAFFSLASIDVLIEPGDAIPDTIPGPSERRILLEAVSELSREIKQWEGVDRVESVADQAAIEEELRIPGLRITVYPLSRNPYVSKDQENYRIHVKLKDQEKVHAIAKKISLAGARYEPALACSVYSDFLYFDYINHSITHSLLRSFGVSALFILVVLLALTRQVRATAISLLANATPLGFLILLFYVASINLNITTSLTLLVCLGLIVDDTIHILYRRIRLRQPLDELGSGVLTTSILLTLGFATFTLSRLQPIQFFGLLNACVFLVAVVSDLAIISWLLNEDKAVAEIPHRS